MTLFLGIVRLLYLVLGADFIFLLHLLMGILLNELCFCLCFVVLFYSLFHKINNFKDKYTNFMSCQLYYCHTIKTFYFNTLHNDVNITAAFKY